MSCHALSPLCVPLLVSVDIHCAGGLPRLDPGTSVCGVDGGQLERKSSYVVLSELTLFLTHLPYFFVQFTDEALNVASEMNEQHGGDGKYSFQELCDQWVNFS
jgi:hypothetical protein